LHVDEFELILKYIHHMVFILHIKRIKHIGIRTTQKVSQLVLKRFGYISDRFFHVLRARHPAEIGSMWHIMYRRKKQESVRTQSLSYMVEMSGMNSSIKFLDLFPVLSPKCVSFFELSP
jgi:hypothetical protein